MAKHLTRAYSKMSHKTSVLPDRWDVYCPLGKAIPGTKFIPFKVPLNENALQKMEEKDRFSPMILIQKLGDQGLKLGLVIDLTNTLKYYDSKDFTKESIAHTKIFTKGHEVPSQDVYKKFAHAVRTFNSDELIGVHCTHGVNRTGYLICRYMIEEMDMEPDNAISLFNEARGHDLERQNYLSDLKTRKGGKVTKKDRWRHHKEDHPGWHQNSHPYHRNKNVSGSSSFAAANQKHQSEDHPSSWHKYSDRPRESVNRNFPNPGSSARWQQESNPNPNDRVNRNAPESGSFAETNSQHHFEYQPYKWQTYSDSRTERVKRHSGCSAGWQQKSIPYSTDRVNRNISETAGFAATNSMHPLENQPYKRQTYFYNRRENVNRNFSNPGSSAGWQQKSNLYSTDRVNRDTPETDSFAAANPVHYLEDRPYRRQTYSDRPRENVNKNLYPQKSVARRHNKL